MVKPLDKSHLTCIWQVVKAPSWNKPMTLKIKKQGGEQGGVVESGCPGFFKI
jgi:hypothetical protein